jgi:hypothetical protein
MSVTEISRVEGTDHFLIRCDGCGEEVWIPEGPMIDGWGTEHHDPPLDIDLCSSCEIGPGDRKYRPVPRDGALWPDCWQHEGRHGLRGDVATGQLLGGMDIEAPSGDTMPAFGSCEIVGLAAGTYDFAIQYKASPAR